MDTTERFDKDGFLVLENSLDPALVEALLAEYQRQFPDVSSDPRRYVVGDRRLQVTMQLLGPFLSPTLYANPAILEVVAGALGPNFVIDNFSLVTAQPQAADQHVHTDHPDLFPEHICSRAVIRPYAVSVAIPLIDLTPDTGTTKLFAGSHKSYVSEDNAALPYVQCGSCFLMDYRLHHQGTENRSSKERPIVYIAYARAWFTDLVNYGNNVRINIDESDLATVPPKHHSLFRRLAARGAFDRPIDALFNQTH